MTLKGKYGETFSIKSSGDEYQILLSLSSGDEFCVYIPKKKVIRGLKKFLNDLTNKEKSSKLNRSTEE